jgi:hypothetical protein
VSRLHAIDPAAFDYPSASLFEGDEDADREWSLGERVETRALVPVTRPAEAASATAAPIATVFVPSPRSQPAVTLADLFGVLLGMGAISALFAVMAAVVFGLLFR